MIVSCVAVMFLSKFLFGSSSPYSREKVEVTKSTEHESELEEKGPGRGGCGPAPPCGPQFAEERPFTGLKRRSTRYTVTSYFYIGLVLGCIDADLCK